MNPPRTPEAPFGVTHPVGALLAVTVFLSRLPFVSCGDRTDSDTTWSAGSMCGGRSGPGAAGSRQAT
jgi:hypothetical protein